ncbi:MAG: glycosyltransferase [Patescibacteria group bacterium]
MNTRPTTTVLIPAFNEEANIRRLIQDCLKQDADTFDLQKIIIISDGSSDATVSEAQSIQDSRVTIFAYTDRLGKAQRLNTIYKTITTDLIINLDADVRITDTETFKNLIHRHMIDNADVVCGISLPLEPQTFVEQAAFLGSSIYVQSKYKLKEKMGKNCIDGRIFSCTAKSIKNIEIPANSATDTYTYFYFKLNNNNVVFEPKASVLFRLPSTMKDYIRQHKRYERPNYHLYFAKEFLEKEDIKPTIPWTLLLFKKAVVHPLRATCLIFMHFYSKYASKSYKRVAVWEHISSSKRV